MTAAVYRVTLAYRKGRFSPTETYYSASTDNTLIGPVVQKLIDARTLCLPSNVEWIGVRIGLAAGGKRGRLFPPDQYSIAGSGIELKVPQNGSFSSTLPTGKPDQGRSCLQCRLVYDGDRAVVRYLAFVPDSVLTGEADAYDPNGNPNWADAFGNLQAELKSGRWQVKARNRGVGFEPAKILQWVQSEATPANMGVVLLSATAPPVVEGEYIQILGARRKGTDKLSYNGRYVVASINTTLQPGKTIVYLDHTEIGNPDSVKIKGHLQRIGDTFYPINFYHSLRAGVHKRGNSFGAALGRRQTRASLDP